MLSSESESTDDNLVEIHPLGRSDVSIRLPRDMHLQDIIASVKRSFASVRAPNMEIKIVPNGISLTDSEGKLRKDILELEQPLLEATSANFIPTQFEVDLYQTDRYILALARGEREEEELVSSRVRSMIASGCEFFKGLFTADDWNFFVQSLFNTLHLHFSKEDLVFLEHGAYVVNGLRVSVCLTPSYSISDDMIPTSAMQLLDRIRFTNKTTFHFRRAVSDYYLNDIARFQVYFINKSIDLEWWFPDASEQSKWFDPPRRRKRSKSPKAV